ncbi:NAD(P)/FAD-dependent oxidoreductase [Lachnospiraceae bacterium 46-15]
MIMKKVIIVGAGASGLMAAITAARQGASVTVLEQMEKSGKKLLVTGNGRCNLTNRKEPGKDTYRGAEETFVSQVLKQFPAERTLEFFHGLGLLTRERDGYIYPYTDQAGSVLEVLMQEIRRLKIKMKYKERVSDIRRTEEGLVVYTDTWKYACDYVILCAGGMAAAQTGSDGSGYELARKCGHSLRPVYPALVPLKVQGSIPRMLSGTRNYVNLSLEIDGEVRYWDSGELQWTDYGVSGIVVFQLSRFAAEALGEKKDVRLHVDMMPEYSGAEIKKLLEQKSARFPEQAAAELLAGLWKEKTIRTFLKLYGKKRKDFCENAVSFVKNLTLEVTGTKSFEAAQVCAGGVPAEELCAETLESRVFPGLYLAGELLDVDGACGGYNLQWAWASGYIAGSSAGRKL